MLKIENYSNVHQLHFQVSGCPFVNKLSLEDLPEVIGASAPGGNRFVASIAMGRAGDLNADEFTLNADYVISVRGRGSRNLTNFQLPSLMEAKERRKMEIVALKAFVQRSVRYNRIKSHIFYFSLGRYLALPDIKDEFVYNLEESAALFRRPTDQVMSQDWPMSRDFWVDTESSLLVWINEMDHLRVISMEMGSNIRRTFERYCLAMNELEANLHVDGHSFARSNT